MAQTATGRTFRLTGFQVVRILGTGARSTIWEVRQEGTGRILCLKRVVRQGNEDNRYFQQVSNEMDVGAKTDHPNLRKIHSLQKIRKLFNVVEMRLLMELAPGQTLQQNRPVHPVEILNIFAQVAQAVHHMNSEGFAHADLKPNNIIVDTNGNAMLIDFGQSCPLGTVKPRIQGTPEYMAPEQVHRGSINVKTDIYNFGATLYWAITGETCPSLLPQNGSLELPGRKRITPPEKINKKIPATLGRLVMECLNLHPSERPESMQQVHHRLGRILRKQLADTNHS